ncbi:MAG: CGNR zinc finger domain-containing protein [Candidatus Dormiibacterota bacterium]
MHLVSIKMKFESYADRGVESAVELVNRLSPGWSRGRSWELPLELSARRALAQELEAKLSGKPVTLRGQAGEELIRLAADLRSVFELMAQGRQDRAAALVNALLSRYQAAPQLARHDGESWHLHFHSQDKEAGHAVARGAMCVIALAVVIGSPGGARLGLCSSGHCDRAFIDTSKNGSRRFCSSTCLSRTKVAAFRARRADLKLPLVAPSPAVIPADFPSASRLGELQRRARLRAE